MLGRDAGGVTLQWNSVKDQRYMILYRDSQIPKSRWEPLPGATELIGTGELMTVRDESPGSFYRSYRTQTLVPVTEKSLRSTIK